MKNIFLNSFINQLYKKNSRDSSVIVLCVLTLVIILFLLLQFRSPLLGISFFRDKVIANFLQQVQDTQQVDMQELWKLRDKLGAVVNYNADYLNPQSIFEFKQVPHQSVQLFEYNAEGLESKEYLLLPHEKDTYFKTKSSETVYFTSQSALIVYDSSQHTVRILTALPFDEMKKHNGMIDYRELKQDLSERVWLTSTVITVSPQFSLNTP